jgi:Grx4 family monothiol glutaredoxin
VSEQNSFYETWYEAEKKKAFRDIESYVNTHKFFIFMKGSKDQPKCKFTRKLVETLSKYQYDYGTFDILQDERIRQWIKVFTKWPTIPQMFINQKFIGGLDIVLDLIDGEEFDDMVPDSCKSNPAIKA